MPFNLASIFFFLANMFPKTFLFHTFAAVVKPLMTMVRELAFLHESTSRNSGWDSQQGWKRNGLGIFRLACGSSLTRIGQWPEFTLVICFTLASGYKCLQLVLQKLLSSLYWIRFATPLKFDHV